MNNYDVSHNFDHIERVVKLSEYISFKENIISNKDIFHIKMGALLHDIGDNKYINNNITQYKIINNYLNKLNINCNDKKEILNIACNISLSKDTETLFNYKYIKKYIVQDADRIDSLGSIGILRYVSYNIIKLNNSNFDNIVYNIEERTNRLMNKIKTNTGKELANKEVKIIKDFINNYKNH